MKALSLLCLFVLAPFVLLAQFQYELGTGFLYGYQHKHSIEGDDGANSVKFTFGNEAGMNVRYKSEKFNPYVRFFIRSVRNRFEYRIETANLGFYEISNLNYFSYGGVMGNMFSIGRFELGVAAGLNLYQINEVGYKQGLYSKKPSEYLVGRDLNVRSHDLYLVDDYSDGYFLFFQPEIQYSVSSLFTLYASLILPVYNTKQVTGGKYDLIERGVEVVNFESKIEFTAYYLSLGVYCKVFKH